MTRLRKRLDDIEARVEELEKEKQIAISGLLEKNFKNPIELNLAYVTASFSNSIYIDLTGFLLSISFTHFNGLFPTMSSTIYVSIQEKNFTYECFIYIYIYINPL